MAQKVKVELVDDLDGGQADETVNFGLDGATYEIDLSVQNANKLRESLNAYVAAGRRASLRRKSGRRSAANSPRTGEDAGAIRKWAQQHGYEVSERGRISQTVREAYQKDKASKKNS